MLLIATLGAMAESRTASFFVLPDHPALNMHSLFAASRFWANAKGDTWVPQVKGEAL